MERITLATLHLATAQAVFDQVATHLLTQMVPCRYVDAGADISSCKYRNEGLMCAAGCLIADAEYDSEMMEGKNWTEVVRSNLAPETHDVLITRLQVVHDSHPPQSWRKELIRAADQFQLSTDVLEQEIPPCT